MEISKELLSEVLFGGRVQITGFGINGAKLDYSLYCSINEKDGTEFNKDIPDNYYVKKSNIYEYINIYELAHKCKEWAFNKGYSISIHQSEISGYIAEIHCGWSVIDFHNKFEPEAIIKACEYILREINEKQLQH